MTSIASINSRVDDPGQPLRDYYSWRRDDVLAQVPAGARRVLSVGCASGVTEAELVRRGVEVVGIETNPIAAAAARSRGLHVLEGDAAALRDELAPLRFDCLIYADVLEHIPDPVPLLRHHASLLNPGGRAVVSIPNFRNYRVFWELFVRGRLPEADAGIFDRTHVRVTTLRGVRNWFAAAGLKPIAAIHEMSRRRDKLLAWSSAGLLGDWVANQILIIGARE
jgi:methionine biosynthesis protein MetW